MNTRFLPQFPLQLVVFPGEHLNLHIFEARYRQLIKECAEKEMTFGIPPVQKGKLKEIGTEVQLLAIEKKYPDGKMDIRTQGIGIFEIKEYYPKAPERLYAGAEVEHLSFSLAGDILANNRLVEKIKELYSILKVDKKLPKDPADFQTYDYAHHVGFSLEQEIQFLSILEEVDRQAYMEEHLDRFLPVVQEMESLRERIKLNGHFKDAIPPNIREF